jgi:diguanylate cyclase (GGDEF)-like protein
MASDMDAMERPRKLLPATALGKARLAALLYAIVGTGPQLAQLDPHDSAARRVAGGMAVGLLLADFVVTHARRRPLRLEAPLVGVALVLGGTSLRDPMAVIGLCFSTMTTQSLYGSHRSAFVRMGAAMVALPVTIAIASDSLGRHLSWRSGMVLGLAPQIGAMGLLMRALFAALARQELAAACETLLARTGSRLLGHTDVLDVRAIVREAAAGLCSLVPGAGLLMVRGDGAGGVVEGSLGLPEAPRGAVLAAGWLDGLDPLHGARLGGDTAALDRLAGGHRQWRAARLATAEGHRLLLVGGRDRVPDTIYDAVRTLATQWQLAEANCGAHTELAHQAHHDQLTGLPNRTLFFRELAAAVDAARHGRAGVSLLIADLDDSKQVNDAYGHADGDELLREVAARLREVGGERGLPARFGGDEFALLLDGVDDDAEVDRLADRMRERLLEPFRLTQATVSIGASIGVAGATASLTAGDLMRCADIAMYSAKAKGKNRVERFSESSHGEIAELRLLEEHLAHAVERDEIVLHYQPQIDLASDRCVGVEALVRWQHPTLGLLPPVRFVPLAERTGQIIGLGDHVLRTACRQMAAWTSLPGAAELGLAVNVAARQLVDPGFAGAVASALRDGGLPARRLVLELTESEMIDQEVARGQLRAVAELGVRIAIDDFGTGYASLSSLRSFPVHQLKIDRSFLSDGEEERADAMFRLVISVGRILDLETVVEGVERPDRAELLRRTGVPLAQGFLFARPIPEQDFPDWLAQQEHRRQTLPMQS